MEELQFKVYFNLNTMSQVSAQNEMLFGTFGIHNLKTDIRNLHLKSSMSFPFHTVHDSIDMSLSKLQKTVKDWEAWYAADYGVTESNMT